MSVAFTPEELQYMQDNIDDTLVPTIFISSTICLTVTVLAITLRVFSRKISGSGLGKDDYLLFLSFVFYVVLIGSLCYSTRFGQGRHIILLTDRRALSICNTIAMAMYTTGMATVKLSILCLYRRIFRSQGFLYGLYAIGALILAWFLVNLLVSLFNTCYPELMGYSAGIEGFCVDPGRFTLGMGVANIVIDFVMLGYPVPQVWKLQMEMRKKIMLLMTFTVGGMACVVSIARLWYATLVASTYDPTWDSVIGMMLSGLEICTAIVACCVITFRPLVERCFRPKQPDRKWSSITV